MSDNWEMYFTNVDDESAAVLVDLGVAETAPDPERPILLWMWLHLQSPTDEGFADDAEEPRLIQIEDAFIDAVELTTGAVMVGRVTTCGRREFYFYAKSSEGFEDSVAEAMQEFEEYEYETGEQEDEEWLQYTGVLFPSPENFQQIFNRQVIDKLEESGDPLTKPRLVDHFANFAQEADRDRFASAAQSLGYTKLGQEKSDEADEEFPFGISLQREHAVDWETIDELTFELFDLAREHEGEYAGWGSPVASGSP